MPDGPGRVGLPSFRRWIAGRPPSRSTRATSQDRPSTDERPSSWPSAGSPSWTPRWISRPSASSRIQIAPPGMPSSAGADPPEAQTVCGSNVGCSARVTSRSASRSSSGVGLPQYQKPSQTWWIRREESRTNVAGRNGSCLRPQLDEVELPATVRPESERNGNAALRPARKAPFTYGSSTVTAPGGRSR